MNIGTRIVTMRNHDANDDRTVGTFESHEWSPRTRDFGLFPKPTAEVGVCVENRIGNSERQLPFA